MTDAQVRAGGGADDDGAGVGAAPGIGGSTPGSGAGPRVGAGGRSPVTAVSSGSDDDGRGDDGGAGSVRGPSSAGEVGAGDAGAGRIAGAGIGVDGGAGPAPTAGSGGSSAVTPGSVGIDIALSDGAAGWPRTEVVSADGLRLSVVIARSDHGHDADAADDESAGLPPILALHGFASSAAAGWGRTGHLGALVSAGLTVIAPDLRGHGESERPHEADRYALDTVLADIAAVVAAIQRWVPGHRLGAPVDVIGYSLGARLSWTAVCRGVVPVRRLVLGGFDGRPLFQGVDPERLDRLAAGAPGNDRAALRALVTGLAGTGSAVTPGDEATPAIPTLIVAGDQDPLASGARECAAALPQGSFLSIPGRNHISTVPARAYRQTEVAFLTALTDPDGRSLG